MVRVVLDLDDEAAVVLSDALEGHMQMLFNHVRDREAFVLEGVIASVSGQLKGVGCEADTGG